MRHIDRLLYGGGFLLDDVPITAGIGTAIATDAIGGSNYQRVKLIHGADGVNAGDVSTANGVPIQPQTGLSATPFPTVAGLKLAEQYTRQVISFAASGDNIVVTPSGGNGVLVYGLVFTVDSPVSVLFKDSTPTSFSGAMKFNGGSGLFLPPYGEPYFRSAAGKNLVFNLSAAVQCSGILWYVQAP